MRPALILLVFIATFAGCDSKTKSSSDTEASQNQIAGAESSETQTADENSSLTSSEKKADSEPSLNAGLCSLRGRITLDGPIPPPRKLSINKDEQLCGAKDTIQEVSGTGGGVAQVVIEIKGASTEKDWPKTDGGFDIRQKNCQFTPTMLVIPVGENVTVYNDDPVGHNVNTGEWNVTQPSGGDPIVKPINAKAPTPIRCNIHSWMEGWIYPAQSPLYAVTNDNGEYEITDVPPGKYRVSIWHSYLGRSNERVTLEVGNVTKLDHEFKSK